MAKARGSIERRRKLEKLPYIVECRRPLRNDVEAWARRTCGADGYLTTSREVRNGAAMPRYILRVHFADEATAKAFALQFGLPYPAPATA